MIAKKQFKLQIVHRSAALA